MQRLSPPNFISDTGAGDLDSVMNEEVILPCFISLYRVKVLEIYSIDMKNVII